MTAPAWDRRAKWAEKFLAAYADGDRQKLLGGYEFRAAVRHLAGAVQQLTGVTPECPYCGATEGLRVKSDGGMFAFGREIEKPEYTCEACFTGSDDGPCFDDLKLA